MTWTAPGITRASWPPASLVAGERTLADQWLDFHRQTRPWKCSGPTGEQLKSRVYTIMIQEYSRRNGHADLIRERIDGQTGH